ncbi:MAG: serine dehydratase subunit alpha family protein [Bacteroidales bacterium]|nr:serine dehydratase subunit alpha family protein [Bacteroidales bacterium]
MTKQEKEQIIALIQQEVVPATGCTEPVAVALAVAKAKEVLGAMPKQIQVFLSANILKNAMGVGIPGTGMFGLPIAIALGALIGKSEYELNVLQDTTPEAVEQGKQYIKEQRIQIEQKKDTEEKLYIEVRVHNGEDNAKVIISQEHTHFSLIVKNGEVLLDQNKKTVAEKSDNQVKLNLRKVYDFATTTPVGELSFIMKAVELNSKAAAIGLKKNSGHSLGKTILHQPKKKFFGKRSTYAKILAATSSACDARMAGEMVPVMSNSGSGNQGIAATMPVVVYAQERRKSKAELIRALIMSHLTVIYIKQSFGRLSPLCGCVVAATGSACGLTYLMDGTYEQIAFAVKNMIANITGMICDGAKPSCSLKVATGASTAILSSMLAIENKTVSSVEGIITDDVDQCILNMNAIGTKGMSRTDELVLDMMTHKS